MSSTSAARKATPVAPPTPTPEGVVEVDMTKLYYTVGVLCVSTVALGATNVVLWRRTKETDEYQKAIRDYVQRLVNRTECGREAYDSLIRDVESDAAPVDWADEDDLTYPRHEESLESLAQHHGVSLSELGDDR